MNRIGLQTLVAREVQRFLRVGIQTLVSPWINAFLYIFVFGFVIGSRIDTIAGIRYIAFVIPGIVMLNVLTSAFMQTSSSLYFQRFAKHIEELLVAPLSYGEMVLGYVLAGVLRGLLVGFGVYVLAVLFGVSGVMHVGLLFLYAIAIAAVFSFLGLLVGLWAESFEQLSVLNTFVITPLTFLGGMFNSISMLPSPMQTIVRFNPFFYFVDGLRYSMTGIREANPYIGVAIIGGLLLGLGWLTIYLFRKGWKIRT